MSISGKLAAAVFFLLVLAVAIFFRFAYLGSTPPGLYPDEAMNGLDALKAAEVGNFKVFYPDNNGREGLFINLQALAVSVFGNEPRVLRAVSGVFGVLAVAGIFFLAQLLYGTKIALTASYLSAVGFWAVNFSRIGFRAIMLPAILVWSFYFLWLGFKKQKSWPIFTGGFIFGLGMHSYISFRIAPLLLLLLLIDLWLRRTYPRPLLWRWAGMFLAGAVLTALPILAYYAQNPSDFLGRAAQVSIFEESSPLASLAGAVVKTLGMFNFAGDTNWRHNLAGQPLLYWPVGVGFLIGMIILLTRLRQGRAVEDRFLLAWFLVMLIPNFFAPEGAPHALRALGAQPAVYIVAAIGLWKIYNYFQARLDREMIKMTDSGRLRRLGRIKIEAAILALVILIFVGVREGRAYFVRWANAVETQGAFSIRLTRAADFLKISSAANKYFVVNEGGIDVNGVRIPSVAVRFLTWPIRDQIRFLNSEDIGTLPANLENAVIVFALPDERLRTELAKRYPASITINSLLAYGIRIP